MTNVYFYNKSLLPLECIKTFGVSAKETDSPIGYFGTGLKYAISVLLREGCEITISIDNGTYEFRKVKKDIRGKEFELVYMDDDVLPFTTELGKNWSLWQAYRELYSNCLDEGGGVSLGVIGADELADSGTIIVVSGLENIHKESGNFILRTKPKYTIENLEIHESETPGIFYRGIKVLELDTKYSYNILSNLTLTEDRTASQWEVNYELTKALVRSEDLDVVSEILSIQDEKYYEARMDWTSGITPSEGFMRLVNGMKSKTHTLRAYYDSHYPSFIGKLDRAVLSKSAQSALDNLRNMFNFKPKSILLAAMTSDYQLNGDEIVMNVELLANKPRLRFSYAVALHKLMENKKNRYNGKNDYEIVVTHLLKYLKFEQPQKKSAARKAASHA